MKQIHLILVLHFALFVHFSVLGQDCDNAILLKDSVYQSVAPKHAGRQEFGVNSKKNLYYFEKEHHTVWYKFMAKRNCELTFELIPATMEDDYDFLLFQSDSFGICEDIRAKKLRPVRTNISKNNKQKQSRTGLIKNAIHRFVHSGKGASHSRSVRAKRGDVFFLVVDNVQENGQGHTLKIFDCLSIDKVSVSEKENDKILSKIDTSASQKVEQFSEKQITYLDSLRIGRTVTLKKVFFHENSSFAKMESSKELEILLSYMQKNPKVKIRIHAHTNGNSFSKFSKPNHDKMNIFLPHRYMAFDKRYCKIMRGNAKKLSQARAYSIRNYLINHKIHANRLTVKAWGSRKMLVSENAENNYLNRRVEVELISQ